MLTSVIKVYIVA